MTFSPSSFAHWLTSQPHSSGGGVQEDRVARLERMDPPQQICRGEPAHGHGRRGLQADAWGSLISGAAGITRSVL